MTFETSGTITKRYFHLHIDIFNQGASMSLKNVTEKDFISSLRSDRLIRYDAVLETREEIFFVDSDPEV